ncbi:MULTISPECIES: MarR family winged helix-turn-helix transcriptional regulator [Anaerotruncus]|uniref:MarR family winged helix-turn-helix transcriptional regulator n=1 Tax=Anaerotruncus TaxID=244127 RepID=UPI000831A930|nr:MULTISPECIES: MarR family transcriptional regulator [Anaerotruncus]RGX56913.1 MarR family transcriptional regulator [Anaerotruncus sp. AF02-27]
MTTPNLKNALYDFFRSAATKMNTVLNCCCEPYGLTGMQARVLMELSIHQPQAVGELGRMLSMSSGNISAMCKQLEKKGLLRRARRAGDERIVEVMLTESGEDIIRPVDAHFEEAFARMLSSMSEAELSQIVCGFQKMSKLFTEFEISHPKQEV